MGIEFTKDERDKRPGHPLSPPERPGFNRRWVRIRGYNQETHMARMQEAGYVPVERSAETKSTGSDPRIKSTQGAPLDSTVKRGDLMLMECPEDKYSERRRAQQELTESRTRGVMTRFREEVRRQSGREPLKE